VSAENPAKKWLEENRRGGDDRAPSEGGTWAVFPVFVGGADVTYFRPAVFGERKSATDYPPCPLTDAKETP
jgi:hypothetical protein